jgi:hypothetical protein
MSKVTIFRFKMYDSHNDEMVLSKRWGTREAIEHYPGGLVLVDTAVEVDGGCVKSDLQGFTVPGFDPHRLLRDGFETQTI